QGDSVANADVHLSILSNDWTAGFGNTRFGRTDSKGCYEIQALPNELEYILFASADDFQRFKRRLGQFAKPGRVELDTVILQSDEPYLKEQVNTSIDLSALKGGIPLSQAIELIQHSIDPPLPIVVDWDELEVKAGVLPADRVRPGGYVKAPIQDALQEIFYYLSYNSGAKQPVGYIVDSDRIIIKANPYGLVQKTYTLDPKLKYDKSGGILSEHVLRGLLIEQLRPLMDCNELWKRDARDLMLDEDRLKVIATEEAHLVIAEKLATLKATDLQGTDKQEVQIAIESRFLLVDDNFLEDIGLEVPDEMPGQVLKAPADSKGIATILEHKPLKYWPMYTVFAANGEMIGYHEIPLLNQSDILDDLQAKFILRAAQARAGIKQLTAPKTMVLNGGSARLQTFTSKRFQLDADGEMADIDTGVRIDIQPFMQNDDKDVLLKGYFLYSDIVEQQSRGEGDKAYSVPVVEAVTVPLRGIIPDKATAFIVGPEITNSKETQEESDVSILNRFSSGRSKVTDKQRLLIMIKPTVIEPQDRQLVSLRRNPTMAIPVEWAVVSAEAFGPTITKR
ncbi:MAG: hypothetical protein ACYSUT_09695, partial [Planctomycetota bacterium]